MADPRCDKIAGDVKGELRIMPEIDKSMNLHVGEWVEVRSATEILATLDDSQSVAGLPFMPECFSIAEKDSAFSSRT